MTFEHKQWTGNRHNLVWTQLKAVVITDVQCTTVRKINWNSIVMCMDREVGKLSEHRKIIVLTCSASANIFLIIILSVFV